MTRKVTTWEYQATNNRKVTLDSESRGGDVTHVVRRVGDKIGGSGDRSDAAVLAALCKSGGLIGSHGTSADPLVTSAGAFKLARGFLCQLYPASGAHTGDAWKNKRVNLVRDIINRYTGCGTQSEVFTMVRLLGSLEASLPRSSDPSLRYKLSTICKQMQDETVLTSIMATETATMLRRGVAVLVDASVGQGMSEVYWRELFPAAFACMHIDKGYGEAWAWLHDFHGQLGPRVGGGSFDEPTTFHVVPEFWEVLSRVPKICSEAAVDVLFRFGTRSTKSMLWLATLVQEHANLGNTLPASKIGDRLRHTLKYDWASPSRIQDLLNHLHALAVHLAPDDRSCVIQPMCEWVRHLIERQEGLSGETRWLPLLWEQQLLPKAFVGLSWLEPYATSPHPTVKNMFPLMLERSMNSTLSEAIDDAAQVGVCCHCEPANPALPVLGVLNTNVDRFLR